MRTPINPSLEGKIPGSMLIFNLWTSNFLVSRFFFDVVRWLPLILNDSGILQRAELIQVKRKGCNHHFNPNSSDRGN